MLILSIDTTGRQGSVALARAGAHAFELIDSAPIAGGTFSAELVPQIAELLSQHGLRKEQIDGLVAASGPGSFTGLRVGLSVVKALAEILKKPIAIVSLLEALAVTQADPRDRNAGWEIDAQSTVAAVLDAGRGEAYLGTFALDRPLPRLLEERCLRLPELADMISAQGKKLAVVTPDVALLVKLRELLPDPNLLWVKEAPRPGSADVARLGAHRLMAGETVSVDELDANYVRRSDAELYSLPKILSSRSEKS